MKTAHLSDLHFGRRVSSAKVESLRADLTTQGIDLLIISGDLTDQGRVSQFRQARDFLRSVGIPFVSVPGNREIGIGAAWECIIPGAAMSRYASFFGTRDRVVFRSDEHKIVFFGVNSVHQLPSWPGRIARETRHWLKTVAADFPGYFKGLFLHHPVVPVIRSSSFWAHSLSDAGEVLNICTSTGISLILQGHKHRSAVMEVRFPERDAALVVSACGAPLMPYWDSIYHVIEISGASILVQPREFLNGGFVGKRLYEFSTDGNRS